MGNRLLSQRTGKKRTVLSLAAALFTALTVVAFPPVSPALDHTTTDLVIECPDPIIEGDSDTVEIRWPGYHRNASVFYYTHIHGHTADHSDFRSHYRTVRVGDISDTMSIPVITTQDSRIEYDETFEIVIDTNAIDAQLGIVTCVITIVDDDAPTITNVAVTSNPARRDVYRSGENIDVTLTFDYPVVVVGDASITLRFGDRDRHTTPEARYLQGSGTRFLVFRYQIQPSDRDFDGITVSSAGTSEDQDTIEDLSGAVLTEGRATPIDYTYVGVEGFCGTVYAKGMTRPIDYTHAGIETASNHKVDGRPYVTNVEVISTPPDGWEAYRANQTIEIALNFDIDVEVEGEVSLALYVGLVRDNWAEAWRESQYLRGSGTNTLVFGYNVQPGDTDIRGIAIPKGTTAVLGDGTIKAAGTDVEYLEHFAATGHLPDHKIDTATPTISGIYITSWPSDRSAYRAGETITVEVVFREPVAKTGDLQLELDIGGTTRSASLRPPANPNRRFNNDMVFEYQVQGGDFDSDGIGISANSLKLNGGTIQDRAGNPATLSHQPIAAHPRHTINTNPDQ